MKWPCTRRVRTIRKAPLPRLQKWLPTLDRLEDRLAPSVVPAGSEFHVNSFTINDQFLPSMAADADGDFVVVWESQNQTDDPAGGVYGQRYNAAGVAQGGEFHVNSFTTDSQLSPTVAMDADGDFVVVWIGGDGDRNGIFGQRFNAAGTRVGGEFRVNTFVMDNPTGPVIGQPPAVAMDADGVFVVVWASMNPTVDSSFGIYGQRFNAAGTPVGDEFHANTFTTSGQGRPAVAMDDDGDFVVVWQSYNQAGDTLYGIYGQRFNAAGTPVGGEFHVNTFLANRQLYPSVAMDSDGEFVVAWESLQDAGTYGIYAQRFNAGGTAVDGEFRVNSFTTGHQRGPAVVMDDDGDFVVVWASYNQTGDSLFGVYGQRFSRTGLASADEFHINTFTGNDQGYPAPAIDADGDFIVAWQSTRQTGEESNGIYAQRFEYIPAVQVRVPGEPTVIEPGELLTQHITQLTVEFDEDMSTLGGASGQTSVLNPANYSLTRNGVDYSGHIVAVFYGNNAGLDMHEALLAFDAALPDGNYELTVHDLIQTAAGQALDGDDDGLPGGDFTLSFIIDVPVVVGGELHVNTFTTGSQREPAVAVDADGDFVVVWHGNNQPGDSDYGIYAQRFNAAGTPIGPEIHVNTFTTDTQFAPSVAMDADGDFVIVWHSYNHTGDGKSGIYGQRFNAMGTPQGGEFHINTYTTDNQVAPEVAMDAEGNFVVVWSSRDQTDDNFNGVFGQYFNAAGEAVGAEFHVNTFTLGGQSSAAVAMDADGDFVVVWESFYNTGDDRASELHGQRFTAGGAAVGAEFHINTFTTDAQRRPEVGMDADGDFAVVWTSHNQTGESGYGIYGQRFTAAGTSVGSEFHVNTFTTDSQKFLDVAVDADGDFVVVWNSNNQPGDSGYGVFGQRFTAAGTPQGGEFHVNTFTTGHQGLFPAVAMDAEGDFVVAWQSENQPDDSSFGIYARVFLNSVPNTSPTTSGIGDVTVAEDAANSIVDLFAAFADAESPDAELVYTLFQNSNPDLFSSSHIASGQLTLDYAANASGSSVLTVRATDPGGLFVEASFIVTVTAVNDAPTLDAPEAKSFRVNTAKVIRGIRVRDIDVDEGNGLMRVSLSVLHGSLTLKSTRGLSFVSGANSTASMTFDGTRARVNAALKKLVYLGNVNFAGPDTITISVDDRGNTGSGGIRSDSAKIQLAPVANLAQLQASASVPGKKDLVIYGSEGNDTISVKLTDSSKSKPTGKSGMMTVIVNSVIVGTAFKPTASILVFGLDGNDTITLSGKISKRAFIDGGNGDDTITGGGGADILLGGVGADVIEGGNGRNLLIGGADADALTGGQLDDILINGTTGHDDDGAALDAIMAEWTSASSYNIRADNLAGALNVFTVFDDFAADALTGGLGLDWFWRFDGDTHDEVVGERTN